MRYDTEYVVDKTTFEKLRSLSSELGLTPTSREPTEEFSFLGSKFVLGERTETRTSPSKKDLAEITKSIVEARKQSDLVIVSIHNHENLGTNRMMPPTFIQEFARACIDAGAHSVVGHGPHMLRGIEVYKGKPILYSLGNFIFQHETVKKLAADFYERFGVLNSEATPLDALEARIKKQSVPDNTGFRYFSFEPLFWQSIIAFMNFEGDELKTLELVPVTLGFDKPRSKRGRPMLADPEEAKAIVNHVAKLSEPWRTSIIFREGRGFVTLDS